MSFPPIGENRDSREKKYDDIDIVVTITKSKVFFLNNAAMFFYALSPCDKKWKIVRSFGRTVALK